MVRYILTIIGMLGLIGAATAQAAEDDPAAYILEVVGGAPPGLEEFAAIDAGAAFVLPGATTVAFNHLAMCKTIRVKGGILIITAKDFSLPGGEVLSTEESACPEKITLESEGVVGGVRLRSFGKKRSSVQPDAIHWSLPIRPVIFLRGKRAAKVVHIKVMNGSALILDVQVTRDPVVWPSQAPALAYDTPYLLKLEDADAKQVTETWVRTTAAGVERKSAVVFFYVE